MAEPDHEQHDELMRWHGRAFDPCHVDDSEIQARIAKLARRHTNGKAALAKSRSQVNRSGQMRPWPSLEGYALASCWRSLRESNSCFSLERAAS